MDKVFGWAGDMQGCGFYRLLQPFKYLRAHGATVAVSENSSGVENQFDVIVGQRISKVGPSTKWMAFARRGKHRLIYEVDDALIDVERSNEACYHFFTHPETLDCMERNMRAADLITVSTPNLAERLKPFNENIVVLPNYIDEALLAMPSSPFDISKPDENGNLQPVDLADKVVVGWPGSPTHAGDWEVIASHISQVLDEFRGRALFAFIGHVHKNLTEYVHIPWTTDIGQYYKNLSGLDIGIAPLAKNPFNNCKSYIKALEYAALGIPVIASDEPPYRDFVQHGETGFLFKQPYQFARYLKQLILDEDLRYEMGVKARQLATSYTIQKNWHLWRDAYGLTLTEPEQEPQS